MLNYAMYRDGRAGAAPRAREYAMPRCAAPPRRACAAAGGYASAKAGIRS